MKYDDAAWHYERDFPADLPNEAGATHIGMFLAWLVLNGMGSDLLINKSHYSLEKLRSRAITGKDFLLIECDEKFTDEELNVQGNRFAQYYYNGDGKICQYLDDYDDALCSGLESMYYVKDTWENYEKLEPYINAAFQHWQLVLK